MFLIHISFYLFELQHNYGCEEDELFRSGAAPKMYLIYNSCRYSGMFSNKLVKKSWRIGRCVLKGSLLFFVFFNQFELLLALWSRAGCLLVKLLTVESSSWLTVSLKPGIHSRRDACTDSCGHAVLQCVRPPGVWLMFLHAQDNE